MHDVLRWAPTTAILTCLALSALVPSGFAHKTFAHQFHVSLAEVDVVRTDGDAGPGRLEVALRVTPEDLEEALGLDAGRRVHLDATEDVDALIVAYLEPRFRVADAEERPAALAWVGKEVSHKATWIYFEIALEGTAPFTIENRILVELGNEQVNTVVVRRGDERRTLSFTAASPPQTLPFVAPPAR